ARGPASRAYTVDAAEAGWAQDPLLGVDAARAQTDDPARPAGRGGLVDERGRTRLRVEEVEGGEGGRDTPEEPPGFEVAGADPVRSAEMDGVRADERAAEAIAGLGGGEPGGGVVEVCEGGPDAASLTGPTFTTFTTRAEADDQKTAASTGRTVHAGASDVQTVRKMTDQIAHVLDHPGAGHDRPKAAAFLVNTVGTYLRASGTDRVQRNRKAATADLAYLTGWMAT
ncbi:hypothetical protein AB0A05_39010, partial [Streptomyces sp. NPDC046374]